MSKPHAFTWKLVCGKIACNFCGLVRLRNDATAAKERLPCPDR